MELHRPGRNTYGGAMMRYIADHHCSGANDSAAADLHALLHYRIGAYKSAGPNVDIAGQHSAGGNVRKIFDQTFVFDNTPCIADHAFAQPGHRVDGGMGGQQAARANLHAEAYLYRRVKEFFRRRGAMPLQEGKYLPPDLIVPYGDKTADVLEP